MGKKSYEQLASRLNEKNLPGKEARISFFRKMHEDYMSYFCQEEDLVYWHMSLDFLLNSALLNSIREIGDFSLTAAYAFTLEIDSA